MESFYECAGSSAGFEKVGISESSFAPTLKGESEFLLLKEKGRDEVKGVLASRNDEANLLTELFWGR